MDEKIIITKSTGRNMCGGTDAYIIADAPTEIKSEEMILFDVTSALPRGVSDNKEPLGYVSAFAVPSKDGTFLFLETGESFSYYDEKKSAWAFVKEDVFPSLVRLVKECDMAKDNGHHSKTHGLPENFGGSITIKYKSEEKE